MWPDVEFVVVTPSGHTGDDEMRDRVHEAVDGSAALLRRPPRGKQIKALDAPRLCSNRAA